MLQCAAIGAKVWKAMACSGKEMKEVKKEGRKKHWVQSKEWFSGNSINTAGIIGWARSERYVY